MASSASTHASCSSSLRFALRGSQNPAITKISGMNTTSAPTEIQKYVCHCFGESLAAWATFAAVGVPSVARLACKVVLDVSVSAVKFAGPSFCGAVVCR